MNESIFEAEVTANSTLSMGRLLEKGITRGEGASVLLRGDSRLLDMLEGGGTTYLPEPLLLMSI